jgi:hypothetical protein
MCWWQPWRGILTDFCEFIPGSGNEAGNELIASKARDHYFYEGSQGCMPVTNIRALFFAPWQRPAKVLQYGWDAQ